MGGLRKKDLMLSGGQSLDADAARYFAFAGISDQGTRAAANKFISKLKSIGVWAVSDRICLFVGSDLATSLICAKNLNSSVGIASPTYAQSTGVVLNGTTQAINTQITPSTSAFMGANSQHVAWYCPTASAAALTSFVGGASNLLTAISGVTCSLGLVWTSSMSDGTNVAASSAQPAAHGFGCASRTSSTNSFLVRNGSQIATLATANIGGLSTQPLYVGARNNLGTADQFLTGSIGFFSCGGALTFDQVLALQIANIDFQRALGRYNEAS